MLPRLLTWWTAWVVGKAWWVLAILAPLTLAAAWYAVTAFEMNSDTSRLIRQDTDWKRTHDAFIEAFPQYDQNTFVVVSGNKPHAVTQVTKRLAAAIRSGADFFQTVYSPAANDFLDRHVLLYLDPEQLDDTVSKLADAQPFLTAIAEDHSVRSVLQLVLDALESDEDLPPGFGQMTDALVLATDRAAAGDASPVSWRDELLQIDRDETFYQVIYVKGRQNFGRNLPNAMLVDRLEAIIADFAHPYRHDVRIRLTGQVPLEHGEIVSAMDSARFAGSLALVILVGLLVWGVRSAAIITVTYLSMLCGLVWTAAFAMLAVDSYNTISIIFLVMFIGLGVDFAIHLCLKYQESRTVRSTPDALIATGAELGPAIVLCGVTSAVGFLAFVPTEYVGLGEMGIISGGGMIIAVLVSLTLIPAFFAVSGKPPPPMALPLTGAMGRLVSGNPKVIVGGTLILGALLTGIASRASFDYTTLALKDPDSEAMTTLRELQAEDIVTDYALTFLADGPEAAGRAKAKLLMLDVVSEVMTPPDYLPQEQQEKLFMLEDARFLLDSLFSPNVTDAPFSDADFLALLTELDRELTRRAHSTADPTVLLALQAAVRTLIDGAPSVRRAFSDLIMPPLQEEIEWLKTALGAEAVAFADLPPETRQRLVAADGRVLVSVTPAKDIVPVAAMREFTEAVMATVPHVTGRPVLDLGIGDLVVSAFFTAIGIAVATIFIILILTLRSFIDSLLVFVPLAMTAMMTLSASVLMDLPLNMANVVVIPLIFGLGVDNGIHIVKRYRQTGDVNALAGSSTPKAVFLSNLTTLGTFGALSFSTHQGIYSIGLLLAVALTSLMLLTLVALPALLATFSPASTRARP